VAAARIVASEPAPFKAAAANVIHTLRIDMNVDYCRTARPQARFYPPDYRS
jgi:hypothetical protein